MTGVTIDLSGVTASVTSLRPDSALLKVLGRRAANDLKKHFRSRNARPNRLGGRRTNFWLEVARSVQSPVVVGATSVRVDITHPAYAQKLHGGTIRAKRGKFLTIPIHPEAHGRAASVLERELSVTLFRPARANGSLSRLLAAAEEDGTITVFYVLKESVTQKADPEAFPDRDTFTAGLVEEARKYTIRKAKRP